MTDLLQLANSKIDVLGMSCPCRCSYHEIGNRQCLLRGWCLGHLPLGVCEKLSAPLSSLWIITASGCYQSDWFNCWRRVVFAALLPMRLQSSICVCRSPITGFITHLLQLWFDTNQNRRCLQRGWYLGHLPLGVCHKFSSPLSFLWTIAAGGCHQRHLCWWWVVFAAGWFSQKHLMQLW